MPFSKLDKAWSNLAGYYNTVTKDGVFAGNGNVTYTSKPEFPTLRYSSFDDGLIRGGVVNVGLSTLQDTARIGKFFASGKGALFVIKQVGLQKSNPLLEQPETFKTLSNNNTRLYNLGLNTLTQVPLNALGGHIIRHGILPVGGVGFLKGDSIDSVKGYNYEYIVKENNKNGKNRLVGYLDKLYSSNGNSSIELQSYNGGAASAYGIGKTFIKTTSLSTDRSSPVGIFLQYSAINNYFKTYRDEAKSGNAQTVDLGENYNRPIIGPNDPQLPLPPDSTVGDLDFKVFRNQRTYPTQNIQTRIGTSTSEFGPNNRKTNYKVDSINVIDVTNGSTFYSSSLQPNSKVDFLNEYKDKIDGIFGRDIIKFRIEFLNNDKPSATTTIDGKPAIYTNTDVLAFRAYIDDFQDGMNAKWNSYRYMGRGEDFYVYDGFTRDISVAFTIFAHSPEEMRPIYRKLNYLMSSFAPDYSEYNKMRGNIGYLTVGDYIYRQPGVFTDIKLSGMLDTHWEIALNEPEGGNDIGQYELPKYIKVNLSFKPIHSFLPRKVESGKYDDTPFITPDRKSYPEHKNKQNKFLTDLKSK